MSRVLVNVLEQVLLANGVVVTTVETPFNNQYIILAKDDEIISVSVAVEGVNRANELTDLLEDLEEQDITEYCEID